MGLLDYFRQQPAPAQKAAGASGRANVGGFLDFDELNQELVGVSGLRKWDEMYRTDPDIRRSIGMVVNPLLGATWSVSPAGDEDATAKDKQAADFAEWLLFETLKPTLPGHLAEALPVLLRSGFAPFEHVWGADKWQGKDVLIPKRLALRLPRTIFRFVQDDDEELNELVQYVYGGPALASYGAGYGGGGSSGERHIPMSQLVYYRIGSEGTNWEGTSLLRPVYKPWYIKSNVEKMDALAQEREALGVWIIFPPENADESQRDDFMEKVAKVRHGTDPTLMVPGHEAGAGSEPGTGWGVRIDGFGGSGQGSRNPQPTLQYHRDAIAAAFMSEFMRLGQGQGSVGARATADVQQDPFEASIQALANVIEGPLNELVARAVALNFADVDDPPTVKMGLTDGTPLDELVQAVVGLVQQGVMTPDPGLEDYLRERAQLPPVDPAERERRRQMAEQIASGAAGNNGGAPPNGGQGDAPPGGNRNGGPPNRPNADGPSSGEQNTPASQAAEESSDGVQAFGRQDRPLEPFESRMELDRIESEADGVRARFDAAIGQKVHDLAIAAARAVEAGQEPPPDDAELEQAIEQELEALYRVGRETVQAESGQGAPQGDSPGADGPSTSFAADGSGGRSFAEQAALIARQILSAIFGGAQRQKLAGGDSAAIQSAAEQAGTGALRSEAQMAAMPAINAGRSDEIDDLGPLVAGVRYTSILDGNRCRECAQADDGQVRALDDPVRLAHKPPNPLCYGGHRCRCMEFAVLKDEGTGAP